MTDEVVSKIDEQVKRLDRLCYSINEELKALEEFKTMMLKIKNMQPKDSSVVTSHVKDVNLVTLLYKGHTHRLQLKPDEQFEELSGVLYDISGIHKNQQFLRFNGIDIPKHSTMNNSELTYNDKLTLLDPSMALVQKPVGTLISINVKDLIGRTTAIEIDDACKVSDLKRAIQSKLSINASSQRLIWKGTPLDESSVLSRYDLDNQTIHLVLKILWSISLVSYDKDNKVTLSISKSNLISSLHDKVYNSFGIEPASQAVFINGVILNTNRTFDFYALQNGELLQVFEKTHMPEIRDPINIQVALPSYLFNDMYTSFMCSSFNNILDLKRLIATHHDLSVDRMNIYFKDELMDNVIELDGLDGAIFTLDVDGYHNEALNNNLYKTDTIINTENKINTQTNDSYDYKQPNKQGKDKPEVVGARAVELLKKSTGPYPSLNDNSFDQSNNIPNIFNIGTKKNIDAVVNIISKISSLVEEKVGRETIPYYYIMDSLFSVFFRYFFDNRFRSRVSEKLQYFSKDIRLDENMYNSCHKLLAELHSIQNYYKESDEISIEGYTNFLDKKKFDVTYLVNKSEYTNIKSVTLTVKPAIMSHGNVIYKGHLVSLAFVK